MGNTLALPSARLFCLILLLETAISIVASAEVPPAERQALTYAARPGEPGGGWQSALQFPYPVQNLDDPATIFDCPFWYSPQPGCVRWTFEMPAESPRGPTP